MKQVLQVLIWWSMSLHTLIYVSGSVYGCAVYIRKSEDLSGYDRFPPLDAEYWLLVGRRSERSTTDLWRAQRLQLLDQPTTRWSQSSPSAVAFLCQLLFNKWNEVLCVTFLQSRWSISYIEGLRKTNWTCVRCCLRYDLVLADLKSLL